MIAIAACPAVAQDQPAADGPPPATPDASMPAVTPDAAAGPAGDYATEPGPAYSGQGAREAQLIGFIKQQHDYILALRDYIGKLQAFIAKIQRKP